MEINEVIKQLKGVLGERTAYSKMLKDNPTLENDIKAIKIAIPILEKQSKLEAENVIITAENKALTSLLDSANGALKRAGSKTQFMLHASVHDDNAGPVFKESIPPEDTHVW